MAGLLGLGGGSSSQKTTRYIGIPIQTSLKGNTIPRGWGTFKGGCNLLDYMDFASKAHQTSTGGKGGGGTTTDYTYSATLLLGLVRGPIAGIRKVFRDQAIYTSGGTSALAQAGLSLATGAIGQAVWGYLTSSHPTHALGYSGLAYVYAQNYAINNSATLQNHSFEIQSTIRATVGATTLDDANPADIMADFFSDLPQWPAGSIASLTDYSNYCMASGLLLSPYMDSQRQVSDFLKEVLMASNSDCVWSDGKLRIVPYGDTTMTGNGVTWAPNLTPQYALTWDSFYAADGDDPIKWDFKRPAEAYNYVQLEFLDRTSNYVVDVQPAVDQANIDQYGQRKQDPTSVHSVCDPVVAATLAQLMVQRTCNVRRTGTFELPEVFGLLDPMDLLTVPLRNGSTRFVRITDYQEKPDTASIEYSVEEMLVGVGHAALYSRQAASGIVQNFAISPGNTAIPAIFDVPVQLSKVIGLETWMAVCSATGNPYWGGCEVWMSTDNLTYTKQTIIRGASRMGVTTATFASGSDPDTTNTLSVDLSQSLGQLDSGTTADADNGTTLCYVDGEYVAFSTANLTSAYHYNLTSYLRRGMWGSQIAGHSAGSVFVRLDDYTCKIPYNATDVGRTLYIKLLSFNVYNQALQDLASVSPFTHTVGGPPTAYGASGLIAQPAIKGIQLNWVNADDVGQAAIEIWRSATSSFGGAVQIDNAAAFSTSYNDQATSSATPYWYWVRPRDIAGNPGAFTPSTAGAGATATSGVAATLDIGVQQVNQSFNQTETVVGTMLNQNVETFLFDASSSTGAVYLDIGFVPDSTYKVELDCIGYATRNSGRDPLLTYRVYGMNSVPSTVTSGTFLTDNKIGGATNPTSLPIVISTTDQTPHRYYYITAMGDASTPNIAGFTAELRARIVKR